MKRVIHSRRRQLRQPATFCCNRRAPQKRKQPCVQARRFGVGLLNLGDETREDFRAAKADLDVGTEDRPAHPNLPPHSRANSFLEVKESREGWENSFPELGETPLGAENYWL